MKSVKQILSRISDIPNAFRVLDIMDNAGCDIEETDYKGKYRIKPKWYITEQEAKDLRTIILHKQHYKKRSNMCGLIYVL